MANEQPDILTAEEVAALLRLSLDSVRSLLRQRRLPGVKIGKEWRVRRQDLDEYLRTGHLPQEPSRPG